MQHVELARHQGLAAVGLRLAEHRLARRAVHRHQRLAEVQVDAVGLHIRHQRGHVVGHAEEHRAGAAELDVDGAQHALAAPVVGRQVHRLLWRAGALDGHRWLAEDGAAAVQLLHQVPGVGRQVVAVVAGDAVAAQRVGQALDAMPVELEPGAHHQLLVLDHPAAVQDDGVALGLEGGHGRLDPVHALRQHAGHGAGGGAGLEHATAHQRPAGLVVVDVGGVDDGDVQPGLARQQAAGHRDAGGSAADDHDVVGGVGHLHRRPAAVDDAAHHTLQVVAGAGRALDDLRQRLLSGLRQRPHRCRPHAGAAVGQHRPGQLGHQCAEVGRLRIGDLAALGGQVAAVQALLVRGTGNFVEAGLVGAFAVGAVADDRAEAGLAQGLQVLRRDLRGHRQGGGERFGVQGLSPGWTGTEPAPLCGGCRRRGDQTAFSGILM